MICQLPNRDARSNRKPSLRLATGLGARWCTNLASAQATLKVPAPVPTFCIHSLPLSPSPALALVRGAVVLWVVVVVVVDPVVKANAEEGLGASGKTGGGQANAGGRIVSRCLSVTRLFPSSFALRSSNPRVLAVALPCIFAKGTASAALFPSRPLPDTTAKPLVQPMPIPIQPLQTVVTALKVFTSGRRTKPSWRKNSHSP